VVVPNSCTKEVKVALESNGWLDKKLRIASYTSSSSSPSTSDLLKLVSIPLTSQGSEMVDLAMRQILLENTDDDDDDDSPTSTPQDSIKIPSELKEALHNSMKVIASSQASIETIEAAAAAASSEELTPPSLQPLIRCVINDLPASKVPLSKRDIDLLPAN
jgi:hypothetical protein